MKKYLLICFIILSVIIVGCSKKEKNKSISKNVKEETILIAAASSYNPIIEKIGREFKKEYGYDFKVTYGATGELVDQLKNGAPFDILISADKENIDKIDKDKLVVRDTISIFANGKIGIAVRKDMGKEILNLKDLKKENFVKIGIANPKTAPYGDIAKVALEKAGIYDDIKDKLVYGKNISEIPNLIETKNVDAGIIPITTKNDNLQIINIDEKYYNELPQVAAVVKSSKNKEIAKKFISFLKEGKGRDMLLDYGYGK